MAQPDKWTHQLNICPRYKGQNEHAPRYYSSAGQRTFHLMDEKRAPPFNYSPIDFFKRYLIWTKLKGRAETIYNFSVFFSIVHNILRN
jgi:hypothetical protein